MDDSDTLLACLQSAREAQAEDHPTRVRAALESLVLDPKLDALLQDLGSDRSKVMDLLSVLEGTPKCSRLARRLRKRVEGVRAGRTPGVSVASVMDLDVAPGVCLPPGASMEDGWLAVSVDLVYAGGLSVRARFQDVDGARQHLEVCFSTATGPRSAVLSRVDIAKSQALIERLSPLGAAVHEGNAKGISAFLIEQDTLNGTDIPTSSCAYEMGWQRDGSFQWGSTTIRAREPGDDDEEDTMLFAENGYQPLARGYAARGSFQGWCDDVWSTCTDFPIPTLLIYSSLASVLLHKLEVVPPFFVEVQGTTTSGKTTSLRPAVSLWGRPDGSGLLFNWNSTRNFVADVTAFCRDVPIFVDETKQARRPSEVIDLVYDVSSGRSRGRAAKRGVRETRALRTIVHITGESSILSITNSGGAFARLVSFSDKPFDLPVEEGRATTQALTRACFCHYGHVGPAFVRHLLTEPGLMDSVPTRFAVAAAELSAGLGAVAGRLASSAAVLRVAADIFHEGLGLPQPRVDPWPTLRAALEATDSTEDRIAEALDVALTWASTCGDRFLLAHASAEPFPPGGWDGKRAIGMAGDVAFVKEKLVERLKERGFDHATVFREWKRRGWTDCYPKKRFKRLRFGSAGKVRCIVVRGEAIRDLAPDENASDL